MWPRRGQSRPAARAAASNGASAWPGSMAPSSRSQPVAARTRKVEIGAGRVAHGRVCERAGGPPAGKALRGGVAEGAGAGRACRRLRDRRESACARWRGAPPPRHCPASRAGGARGGAFPPPTARAGSAPGAASASARGRFGLCVEGPLGEDERLTVASLRQLRGGRGDEKSRVGGAVRRGRPRDPGDPGLRPRHARADDLRADEALADEALADGARADRLPVDRPKEALGGCRSMDTRPPCSSTPRRWTLEQD